MRRVKRTGSRSLTIAHAILLVGLMAGGSAAAGHLDPCPDNPCLWEHVDVNIDPNQGTGEFSWDPNSEEFTIKGFGTGIKTGSDDSLSFMYQEVTGDFDFRVTILDCYGNSSSGSCTAGLMIREQLDPNNPEPGDPVHRMAFVNQAEPGSGVKVGTSYRPWYGDRVFGIKPNLVNTEFGDTLRIVRYGDQIVTYAMDPNVGSWEWAHGVTIVDLADTVYLGMGVTGRSGSTGTYGQARFTDPQIIQPLVLPHTTSWVGNSLPGGTQSIQQNVTTLYVDPDPNTGMVYLNTTFDESNREASMFFLDSTLYGALDDTNRGGSYAITTGGTSRQYVYMSMAEERSIGNPPVKKIAYAVRRYNLDGSVAPLDPNDDPDGYDMSMRDINEVDPNVDGHIHGLAWSDALDRLYVSDIINDKVIYFDEDLDPNFTTLLDSTDVTNPRDLALDANDNIWVIADGTSSDTVFKFDPNGVQLSPEITGPDPNWVPTALAVNSSDYLVVADDGPDQNFKRYTSSGSSAGYLGDIGGILSGTKGEVQPKKFNGPTGIGFDANDYIYTASDGGTGTVIKKFDPTGANMTGARYGLEFIDVADVDPNSDGLDVYSKFHHYKIDYSKPNGENWTYVGMSLDRFNYPDDIRLHRGNPPDKLKTGGTAIRRDDDKLFMYLYGAGHGQVLAWYRYDDEIAVPCGMMIPRHRQDKNPNWPPNYGNMQDPNDWWDRWIWVDKDGDGLMTEDLATEQEHDTSDIQSRVYGWYVDDELNVWTGDPVAGEAEGPDIRQYRVALGPSDACPSYTSSMDPNVSNYMSEYTKGQDFDQSLDASDPNFITRVMRVHYVPSTDAMYVGAFTNRNPRDESSGWSPSFGEFGSEIIKYSDWSDPNQRARDGSFKSIELDYDPNIVNSLGSIRAAKSMDVAGDRIYVVYQDTREVHAYDADTGERLTGKDLAPGPEVGGRASLVDILNGLRAFKRANGKYVVFQEDNWQTRSLMYPELP